MQQARDIAIEPIVANYVEKWTAQHKADQVKQLRQAIAEFDRDLRGIDLDTAPEARTIRSMMHPFLMDARQGKPVDLEALLKGIRQECTRSEF